MNNPIALWMTTKDLIGQVNSPRMFLRFFSFFLSATRSLLRSRSFLRGFERIYVFLRLFESSGKENR
jgi:hypothetical protein